MATGKCQSLAMPIVMASFGRSTLLVLLDDDRAAVDDALHEHLHDQECGHAGHAGHAGAPQQGAGRVCHVAGLKIMFSMEAESSRVACEESIGRTDASSFRGRTSSSEDAPAISQPL